MSKRTERPQGRKNRGPGQGAGQHFEDRDLMRGKVPKDQFAPSEAEPVRQRFKMAGWC